MKSSLENHNLEELMKVLRQEVTTSVSRVYETRNLATLCEGLEKANSISTWLPKWLRPFFRNQWKHNALMTQAIRVLGRQIADEVERHNLEITHLRHQIEQLKEAQTKQIKQVALG